MCAKLKKNENGLLMPIKNVHYFDYAATTFICSQALDAYVDFQKNVSVLWGKGNNALSVESKKIFDDSVAELYRHFHVNRDNYGLIFGKNATEIINIIAYSVEHILSPSDIVLVGPYEHHSNFLPWKYLARRCTANFIEMPLTEDGKIDVAFLESVAEDVKIVACSAIANTNGFMIDKKIIDDLFKGDTLIFFDESQSVAHLELQLSDTASGYILSSHKMYGPKNISAAFVKRDLLKNMQPVLLGGGMIDFQSIDDVWSDDEKKFFAGTYDAGLLAAWRQACRYIDEITYDEIKADEAARWFYVYEFLKKYDDVVIYSDVDSSKSLISFTHKKIHSHDIETALAEKNVIVRSGNMCAQNALRKMNEYALTRISFGIGVTDNDIDVLCESLKNCFQTLGR